MVNEKLLWTVLGLQRKSVCDYRRKMSVNLGVLGWAKAVCLTGDQRYRYQY